MSFILIAAFLSIVIFPVYVLAQLSSLRRELDELKSRMGTVNSENGTALAPTPTSSSLYGDAYHEAKAVLAQQTVAAPTVINPPSVSYTPQYVASIPEQQATLGQWFAEDVFMKIGALLILLAFGWFVSYAFMNNWIGPVGRISLGIGFGLFLMVGGIWRAYKDLSQGVVLSALGMSTILLSIFAARFVYDFFTPGAALLLMFATIAVTAAISVRFKVVALAVVALVGGAVAPILVDATNPDVFGLNVYLGLLFAGALVVAALMRQAVLVLVSLMIAVLYGVPYFGAEDLEQSVARLGAFIFCGAFLFFSTLTLVKTKVPDYQLYLTTTLGIAVYLVSWIIFTVPVDYQGHISLIVATLFLFAGSILWQAYNDKLPSYVYGGVGLAYVALATSYYLDGASLLVVYLAQITTMILVSLRVMRDIHIARAFSWLYSGVIVMSLPYFDSTAWASGVIHADSIILVIIASTLVFVGFSFASAGDESRTDATLITIGALYFLALIWVAAHTWFGDQIGTAISLVIYTVIGLGLYFGGQQTGDEYARIFGGVLIVGVVARLLLVDVWELELLFRIIAFFVVGVLLLTTAFYLKKQS